MKIFFNSTNVTTELQEVIGNSQIIPISCSTNIGQQSMQYLGPKIWNSLPKLVKDCKTVKTFQKQLTKHLLGVDH